MMVPNHALDVQIFNEDRIEPRYEFPGFRELEALSRSLGAQMLQLEMLDGLSTTLRTLLATGDLSLGDSEFLFTRP